MLDPVPERRVSDPEPRQGEGQDSGAAVVVAVVVRDPEGVVEDAPADTEPRGLCLVRVAVFGAVWPAEREHADGGASGEAGAEDDAGEEGDPGDDVGECGCAGGGREEGGGVGVELKSWTWDGSVEAEGEMCGPLPVGIVVLCAVWTLRSLVVALCSSVCYRIVAMLSVVMLTRHPKLSYTGRRQRRHASAYRSSLVLSAHQPR